MSQKSQVAVDTMLIEQLTSQLDDLEAWIGAQPTADAADGGHAKKNLEPVLQRATELVGEYQAFLELFSPLLERIRALNVDAILTGRWANLLSGTPAEATRLLRKVTDAIEHLILISARADAWTGAKEKADLSRRLAKEVEEHAGRAQAARNRLELLRDEIGRFMVAQREREQPGKVRARP